MCLLFMKLLQIIKSPINPEIYFDQRKYLFIKNHKILKKQKTDTISDWEDNPCFLMWKNQHWSTVHTTQNSLHIYCNPCLKKKTL